LGFTFFLVFLVIAISAPVTLCGSVLIIVIVVALSYWRGQSHHKALLASAQQVTPESAPALATLTAESVARLQPGDVEVFVVPSNRLNAYTFGLVSPKAVVLHSALLEVMDADELRFILGHELGHVRLGHTWLNSLVRGASDVSASIASIVLTMAFLWWSRACEHSADRAGLLACGKPHKAISALVKLTAGPGVRTRADLEQALRYIDAEDDHALAGLGEALSTHPMTIRRIKELQRYAASAEYRRL
jgi:Zn-dependent protease with chaperone function